MLLELSFATSAFIGETGGATVGRYIAGIAICLAVCTARAGAADMPSSDDADWWGNSGALPEPQVDQGAAVCGAEARAGSWWWPTAPNVEGDATPWGNRGVVFHRWTGQKKPPDWLCSLPVPPDEKLFVCPSSMPSFNNVLFDRNKAVLRPEGKAVLDQVVVMFTTYPDLTVVLVGHACDLGTVEHNLELGERRAVVVKAYLVEHGVDSGRITTRTFGDTQPAVPNDSEVNRKLNRRVDFDFDPPFRCNPEAHRSTAGRVRTRTGILTGQVVKDMP